jgi:hypothetical protein
VAQLSGQYRFEICGGEVPHLQGSNCSEEHGRWCSALGNWVTMSGPVVAIGENRRRGAAKGKHSGERQPRLARWAFLAMRSKPGCAFSRRYPTLYLVRAIIVRLGDLAMLTSGLRISLWAMAERLG